MLPERFLLLNVNTLSPENRSWDLYTYQKLPTFPNFLLFRARRPRIYSMIEMLKVRQPEKTEASARKIAVVTE